MRNNLLIMFEKVELHAFDAEGLVQRAHLVSPIVLPLFKLL
jgi:hypothetical protein